MSQAVRSIGTVERVDTESIARVLLQAAGLEPRSDEIEALAGSYGMVRAAVDKLYFGETAEIVPGTVFIADPDRSHSDSSNT